MTKIRKRTVHGLKAVGGSFMGIKLKCTFNNRDLKIEKIISRIFFQKCMLREGNIFFFGKVCFEV